MSPPDYWPFWAGGLGLGAVAILHQVATRRPLAVSGGLARLIRFRADERESRAEAALASGGLDDALLAATRARFGGNACEVPSSDGVATSEPTTTQTDMRLPISDVALFVACLTVGATLVQLLSESPADPTRAVGFGLGTRFDELAGSGIRGALQLVVGGMFVGFGARMAGGCTSGHGLSGLASFRLASALATAAMFVGGIAVSYGLAHR